MKSLETNENVQSRNEANVIVVNEKIAVKRFLLKSNFYDLPTGTVSLCLAVDSARTAVVLSTSTMPARQSITRCLMNLEILTVLIVLNGS